MNGYSLAIAIIRRDLAEEYIDFFRHNGSGIVYSTNCEGSARKKLLDMLGLEPKDKQMLYCVVPSCRINHILRHLRSEMLIDAPNTGVAFFINLECIGGASALRTLCTEDIIMGDEVKKMKDSKHSLIVAIVERGHTDLVIDAACEAGATGGTIVHAKGTLGEERAKFFGVSIAEEKDMVYIVVRADKLTDIMNSVMQKAGSRSPARTVMFSLPVEAVAGIRVVDEEQED